VDRRGEPIVDDSFLLLLNPSADTIDWVLPGPPLGERWVVEISSDDLLSTALIRERTVEVIGRSATVLRRVG
jgi:isoamylase